MMDKNDREESKKNWVKERDCQLEQNVFLFLLLLESSQHKTWKLKSLTLFISHIFHKH